jgi:hypothetical protein
MEEITTIMVGGIRLRSRRAERIALIDSVLSCATDPEDIGQWQYRNVEMAGSY